MLNHIKFREWSFFFVTGFTHYIKLTLYVYFGTSEIKFTNLNNHEPHRTAAFAVHFTDTSPKVADLL